MFLHPVRQAGACGTAPRGSGGEEEAAQEPERVRGQVLAAEWKVSRARLDSAAVPTGCMKGSPQLGLHAFLNV